MRSLKKEWKIVREVVECELEHTLNNLSNTGYEIKDVHRHGLRFIEYTIVAFRWVEFSADKGSVK